VITSVLSDTAVFYGLMKNAWQIAASFATIPLIILFFSPVLQGYFYAFKSILDVQTLLVLGMGVVIQQFTSHEWAKLQLNEKGELTGDPDALSRLASLKQFTIRWYSGILVVWVCGLGAGGYLFLRYTQTEQSIPEKIWLLPWLAVCVVIGIHLFISPAMVFLEGCNRVRDVYRIRLFQAVASRLSIWTVLILGGKLWVFFTGTLVSIITTGIFLLKRHTVFFQSLFRIKVTRKINWRTEIWPLQWRVALTCVAGYANFALLIPLLFAFRGPVIAGRMGMTWALFLMLWNFATVLISTKLPAWTIAAARGEKDKLRQMFLGRSLFSGAVLLLGLLVIWLGILLMHTFNLPVSERFLPPVPSSLLAAAVIPVHLKFVLTAYMRAHKQDPFWVVSILEAALAAALLPVLGWHFGATGLAAGFLMVNLVSGVFSWNIFRRSRLNS